jgi:hypothetical protein
MQWVGPPYPSRGKRSRINLIGLVKKESKAGAYRYRHNGMGIHLADATPSIWMQSIEVCTFMNL